MSSFTIRPVLPADQDAVWRLLRHSWGDRIVVSRGKTLDAATLPGFLAVHEQEVVGLITLHVDSQSCEVVTLDAFKEGMGVGSELLKEAERYARTYGCSRLWLITSNDNIEALAFYQRRGFRIVAVHPDAITEARKIKPQIPLVAENGIDIRDEVELSKPLV